MRAYVAAAAPIATPKSIDETQALLASGEYVADRSLATSLFLALLDEAAALPRGRGGVGKTEIAKVVAQALGRELIACSATRASTSRRRPTSGTTRGR